MFANKSVLHFYSRVGNFHLVILRVGRMLKKCVHSCCRGCKQKGTEITRSVICWPDSEESTNWDSLRRIAVT